MALMAQSVELVSHSESESDDEFDQTCFDDDRLLVVDSVGEVLIAFAQERAYEEEEAT